MNMKDVDARKIVVALGEAHALLIAYGKLTTRLEDLSEIAEDHFKTVRALTDPPTYPYGKKT